jgi:hypothetical protein
VAIRLAKGLAAAPGRRHDLVAGADLAPATGRVRAAPDDRKSAAQEWAGPTWRDQAPAALDDRESVALTSVDQAPAALGGPATSADPVVRTSDGRVWGARDDLATLADPADLTSADPASPTARATSADRAASAGLGAQATSAGRVAIA